MLALFSPLMIALAEVPSEDTIKALIAANKTDESIAAARERLAANRNDPDACILLANALFANARKSAGALADGKQAPISVPDAEATAKVLETGIKLAPTRKDIYLGLVDVWLAAEREDEVVRQVRRAASQFPQDPKLMNGLLDQATDRQNRGARDPLARKMFEAIAGGYPQQPEAILAWSSYLLNAGELEKSTQVLEAGSLAAPKNSQLQEALGDALCYKLDFEGAAQRYSRATALDPKRKAARLKWAVTLHLSDPQSARVLAEPLKGPNKSPGVAPTIELGKEGVKPPGRITLAAGSFLRALSNPALGAPEAYTLAKSFLPMALAPCALVETQVALLKDPLQLESWMLRAEIYMRTGLDKQSLEAIEKAEAIFDTAKDRHFTFGRDEVSAARAAALRRNGRDEESLAAYRKLTDPSPYAYSMAMLAERLGRVEEARALLEQVVASGTNTPEVEAAKARLDQDAYRKKP